MPFRRLGRSGLQLSVLSFGSWVTFDNQLKDDTALECMQAAHDAGCNFYDNAEAYAGGESEAIMGRVIEELGWKRQSYVLSTKVFWGIDGNMPNMANTLNRKYLHHSIEGCLDRLRVDFIDLLFCHRADPNTPIEETLRALDDLIRQGKVRYIGCSNLPAWQVVEAQWTSKEAGLHRFVSSQDEYSLLVRKPDQELIPALRNYSMGLLPYYPLAGGFLTGKYQRNAQLPAGARLTNAQRLADRFLTEANWQVVERLGDFAATRGHGLLELAFSWLLARPTVASVIAGATKPEQLEANAKAAGWALTDEDMAEIDQITQEPG